MRMRAHPLKHVYELLNTGLDFVSEPKFECSDDAVSIMLVCNGKVRQRRPVRGVSEWKNEHVFI